MLIESSDVSDTLVPSTSELSLSLSLEHVDVWDDVESFPEILGFVSWLKKKNLTHLQIVIFSLLIKNF